jgi:hypothetical protein
MPEQTGGAMLLSWGWPVQRDSASPGGTNETNGQITTLVTEDRRYDAAMCLVTRVEPDFPGEFPRLA